MSAKGVTPKRKANSLKHINRNIRAAGKLAGRYVRRYGIRECSGIIDYIATAQNTVRMDV